MSSRTDLVPATLTRLYLRRQYLRLRRSTRQSTIPDRTYIRGRVRASITEDVQVMPGAMALAADGLLVTTSLPRASSAVLIRQSPRLRLPLAFIGLGTMVPLLVSEGAMVAWQGQPSMALSLVPFRVVDLALFLLTLAQAHHPEVAMPATVDTTA